MSPSPEGRNEWRSMMRNYDDAPEKVEAARKAVRAQMDKYIKSNKDAGLNQWNSLGPEQVGGRVRAIATHPNDPDILFVGGVSGGIWKSTNGGNTWIPKGDLLPSLAVTSIIVHPTSPDTMFLSTGEGIITRGSVVGAQGNATPGAGIFRSFDGGDTWERIPAITESNIDEFYWINKIIFNPEDPTKIVAVGHNRDQDGTELNDIAGMFHYITDYGEILRDTEIYSNRGGFIDVEWPTGKNQLLIGTRFNLMRFDYNEFTDDILFNSERGGIGGLPAQGILGRVELSVGTTNTDKVYALCQDLSDATFGRLFVSTDFGTNWIEADLQIFGTSDPVDPFMNGSGDNQGWYDNTIWISPLDDDDIIIGGIELWRSLNGGDSFVKISEHDDYDYGSGTSPHADIHIVIEASDFSSSNKKIYVGNDGGIATASNYETVTENSGWSLINNNLSITQFYNSDVRPGTTIIAGAQDNGVSYFDNTGSWSEVAGGDGGYCAHGVSDTIYYSLQNGLFFYSLGPGTTVVLMNVLSTSAFIAPMKTWNGGRDILMADQALWYSPNPTSITSYVDVSPATPIMGTTITAIEVNNDEIVWVGYSDGRVYTADWSNYPTISWSLKGDFNATITDIAVSPLDNEKVALSLGGYRDDNIFISINGGNSWTERSNGMPALHVNSLIWHVSESAWLYAGTDIGVFATEDNGQAWNVSPSFGGISDGPVFTEITNLQWGGMSAANGFAPLYVTTYGRGIWETDGSVRGRDQYFDEDYSGIETGSQSLPYVEIESGEEIQANGQTWFFDAGTYPVDNAGNRKIIIDKRLGRIRKLGTGSVIIGDN